MNKNLTKKFGKKFRQKKILMKKILVKKTLAKKFLVKKINFFVTHIKMIKNKNYVSILENIIQHMKSNY